MDSLNETGILTTIFESGTTQV